MPPPTAEVAHSNESASYGPSRFQDGPFQAAPDVVDGTARNVEGPDAGWLDAVIPACAPGTNGSPRSEARREQALTLEPFERRMNGTRRHVSLEPRLHCPQNRPTIRLFTETQYLKKHCLLKCTEYVCHNDYIVVIEEALSTLGTHLVTYD